MSGKRLRNTRTLAPASAISIFNAKNILNKMRIDKEDKDKVIPNVFSMNPEVANGSFYVPKEEYERFLMNIAALVFDDRVPLGLVERPLNDNDDGTCLSPVRVDLDFRFEKPEGYDGREPLGRHVDIHHAEKFIELLWKEIDKTCDFGEDYSTDEVEFFILQKPQPEYDDKKDIVKDGIHIFCKDIQLRPEIHLFLRKKILKDLPTVLPEECFKKTTSSDIYDESVLYKGNWMIHGNRKKEKNPYQVIGKVSHFPNVEDESPIVKRYKPSELTISKNKELVLTLSIRHGISGLKAPGLKSTIRDELRSFVERNQKAKQALRLTSVRPTSSSEILDKRDIHQRRVLEDQILAYGMDPTETVSSGFKNILKETAWLMDMLSVDRSTDYHSWIRVGILLRNLSRIEGLPDLRRGGIREEMPDKSNIIVDHGMFDLWVEFSKKSPKYIEGEEDKGDWYNKMWLHFGTRRDTQTMIKRPTLLLWAKEDSPERFSEYLNKTLRREIIRVINTGQHTDVAGLVRHIWGDEFICANISRKEWYTFDKTKHRFVKTDSGTTLRRKLYTEFRERFYTFYTNRHEQIMRKNRDIREQIAMSERVRPEQDADDSDEGEVREDTTQRDTAEIDITKDKYLKESLKIANNLGNCSFLDKIMGQCCHEFYQTHGEDFIKNLDTDSHLICFTNGVLDLRTCTLRPGKPDDMISLTTGYDYIEYDEDDEKVIYIREMVRKIFTDPDVREYMWKIFASVLRGENFLQDLYFLNGIGANGKSVIANWLLEAMGDYGIKLGPSIVTQKRGGAESASPEVASLQSKRFVFMEEPDETPGSSINHAILKEWSGGGTIRARRLYSEPFNFNIMFKLFFACNAFPEITTEPAMWRRLKVIEFRSKFKKKDATLNNPEDGEDTEYYRDERVSDPAFIKEHIPQFMSILIEEYKNHWLDNTDIKIPYRVQQFTVQKRQESETLHEIFESRFTYISRDKYEEDYKNDDGTYNKDKIKRELQTEKNILDILRSPEYAEKFMREKRSIGKVLREYLKNQEITPLTKIGTGKYYPFTRKTDI